MIGLNLPIGIEEEHAKEHGNEASHNVVSCQLDGQNKQWNAGEKGVCFFFLNKSIKAPDEET